ncbi:hypothetical protein [Leucobacter japonicus]|uniref:hypothetical protein n=1 Tax=Leucobacter japonicus TaxID=1461259 RepID=UPI000B06A80C|nr:hypothetical protein [Leucobacter japonicus]
MSDKFVASNGIGVQLEPDDDAFLTDVKGAGGVGLSFRGSVTSALREFFQHERDQELGRWRWPENPGFVVYSRGVAGIRVTSEESGDSILALREAAETWADEPTFFGAARAYFAAHPERKPWHDAKPGEAWVITYGGEEHAVISDGAFFLWEAGSEQPVGDSRITSGRRIWPEVSDVQ